MIAPTEALPDWEHYRLAELEEALAGLDRDRFPDRARQLEGLIQRRRTDPKPVAPQPLEFFESAPDWESYSVSELEEALHGLDQERYPDRAVTIRELLDGRRAQRRPSTRQTTATAATQEVAFSELPLLPWAVNWPRLGCYLAALTIASVGIAGLAVKPLGIALSLTSPTGQPVGTLLFILIGLLVAYWPHRRRST